MANLNELKYSSTKAAEYMRRLRRDEPEKNLTYRMTAAARLLQRNGVEMVSEFLRGGVNDGK